MSTDDNKYKENLVRYQEALNAAALAFGPHMTSPQTRVCNGLHAYLLAYAMRKEDKYRDAITAFLNTCLLVSALLLTITAGLLLNPPAFTALGHDPVTDRNVKTRVFFYSLMVANFMFVLCILSGTFFYLQCDRGVWAESDMPAFSWGMRYYFRVCWMSLTLGCTSFTITFTVNHLLTFFVTDAWVAIGIYAAIMVTLGCTFYTTAAFWSGGYDPSTSVHHRRIEYLNTRGMHATLTMKAQAMDQGPNAGTSNIRSDATIGGHRSGVRGKVHPVDGNEALY